MRSRQRARWIERLPAIVILVATGSLISGIVYWKHLRPVNRAGTGLSDHESIRIASQIPEAQAFLKRYPHAEVDVDRSGALAVDFRVQGRGHKVIAGASHPVYLRLRVLLNPRTHRPTRMFLDCTGEVVTRDLLHYLERRSCVP